MAEFLDTALSYVKRGWSVIPLQPRTKVPYPGFELKKYQREQRADEDKVYGWWNKHFPDANIGLATGAISGFFVVDCDDEEAYLNLPPETVATLTVATGKGVHLYFQYPIGLEIGNRAKLLPSVDIRGNGGYVVAPPSIHPSGKAYEWVDASVPIAPAPRWLLDLLCPPTLTDPDPTPPPDVAPIPALPPPPPAPSNGSRTPSSPANIRVSDPVAYAQAAISKEVTRLRRTPEGARNDGLNTAAYNLGQLVGNGLLERFEVEKALKNAAAEMGLKYQEAVATIASGLDDGAASNQRQIATQSNGNGHHPDQPPPTDGMPIDPDDDRPNLTDMGNAARMVKRYADRLRYVPQWGKWLAWDGTRWATDDTGSVMRAAKDTVKAMYREAADIEGDDKRKRFVTWAMTSEGAGKLSAMIELAKTERKVIIRPEKLDANSWLLNTLNVTIDLKTGKTKKHEPSDLLTKRVNIRYDPAAKCRTWVKFLDRIMGGDAELVEFLQRAVGYTLTGSVTEQCLFFMIGTGRNGKSTFVETLMELLGEYGVKTPTETLMAKDSKGVSNDIARLQGMRLVVARETDEGQRLAEATIKDLTGGDKIIARYMYQEFFEFYALFKLWMYGNHKPMVRGTDMGIWRRIRLIPFTQTISLEERDPHLGSKLREELPGILNWALEGCRKWQAGGLTEPKAVIEATSEYRAEMDVLGDFLQETCVSAPNLQVSGQALYATYSQWCESMGERAISQRALALRLKERGYQQHRGTQGQRQWIGIGFKAKDPVSSVPF